MAKDLNRRLAAAESGALTAICTQLWDLTLERMTDAELRAWLDNPPPKLSDATPARFESEPEVARLLGILRAMGC